MVEVRVAVDILAVEHRHRELRTSPQPERCDLPTRYPLQSHEKLMKNAIFVMQ